MIKVLALFALISVVYASVDYAARGLPTEVEWHKCVLSATNPVESLPGTNFVSAEFHLLSAVNTVLTVSSYSEALELSKQNGKPIVVLFTKPWCGACKNLKSQMQGAENFFSVAAKYNMVNVEEDSEDINDGQNWSPNGGYIPRTFLVSADGKIDTTVSGPNTEYPNFFPSPASLEKTMTEFLEKNPAKAEL